MGLSHSRLATSSDETYDAISDLYPNINTCPSMDSEATDSLNELFVHVQIVAEALKEDTSHALRDHLIRTYPDLHTQLVSDIVDQNLSATMQQTFLRSKVAELTLRLGDKTKENEVLNKKLFERDTALDERNVAITKLKQRNSDLDNQLTATVTQLDTKNAAMQQTATADQTKISALELEVDHLQAKVVTLEVWHGKLQQLNAEYGETDIPGASQSKKRKRAHPKIADGNSNENSDLALAKSNHPQIRRNNVTTLYNNNTPYPIIHGTNVDMADQ